MGTYTTAAKVSALMQFPAFSGSTTPTSSDVEEFITRAEDKIDFRTGHAWREVTVTEEFYDISGGYIRGMDLPVYLNHRKLRTASSGSGDKIEVWNFGSGNQYKDFLADFIEGRGEDFYFDNTDGILFFYNQRPGRRRRGLRITYRYGETSVPLDIEEAATKLAAIEILVHEDTGTMTVGGETDKYGINMKIDKWKEDIDRILDRHAEFGIITSSYGPSGYY